MKKWDEIKNSDNVKTYIEFLKNNDTVYYINHFPWAEYQGCLQPAIPGPYEPPQLNFSDIKIALKSSRFPFIRWSSDFTNEASEWWWVVCVAPFIIKSFSGSVRNEIKKGLKNCVVKKIAADWLSQNGYECYQRAFKRYKNAKPVDKKIFRSSISNKKNYNCFEFWGVFCREELIGYAECVIIDDTVFANDLKYIPDYFKYRSSYALIYTILDYYLNQKKYNLFTNGTRSIAHDTQMQEFLEKFGFKKEFCRLNIFYSRFFGFLVKIAYMFKPVTNIICRILPDNISHKVSVVILQEKIARF